MPRRLGDQIRLPLRGTSRPAASVAGEGEGTTRFGHLTYFSTQTLADAHLE